MKFKLPSLSFRKKNSEKITSSFISLDITETSVKAVQFAEESGLLSARATAETYLKDPEKVTSLTLKQTLKDLSDESRLDPSEAIIGLSGQNVFGFILIARQQRTKRAEKITEDEFSQISEKVRRSAYVQAKQWWAVYYASDTEFEPLDMVLTSVKVDDIEVEDPIGLTGEEILVTAFCSYCRKEYYDHVYNMIKKAGVDALAITTTLYSQSKIIGDTQANFILIDIGRKYTDIGIAFGKNLITTKSFEVGSEFFTKSLAQSLNVGIDDANTKKERYKDETLTEDEMDKVGDVVFATGKNWVLALRTVLDSLNGIKSFPNHIYLSGGGAYLPVLLELLIEKDWAHGLSIPKDFEVKLVDDEFWRLNVNDPKDILSGPLMFVPTSLSIIKIELGR